MKNPCEVVAYAMHSSGKTSLAVGLSPYKIAKIDDLASKLAGRLFSLFCMACSVYKFFTKIISTHLLTWLKTACYIISRTKEDREKRKEMNF